ncbi:MAG: hypothetical protein CL456_07215 [Acidimicrobiaceae bacterium]|nr:hypothetical protein [Acidimicrobiaceae bacterium]
MEGRDTLISFRHLGGAMILGAVILGFTGQQFGDQTGKISAILFVGGFALMLINKMRGGD